MRVARWCNSSSAGLSTQEAVSFDSQLFRCQVTTLGKLFKHMSLSWRRIILGSSWTAVMSCDWEGNCMSGIALAHASQSSVVCLPTGSRPKYGRRAPHQYCSWGIALLNCFTEWCVTPELRLPSHLQSTATGPLLVFTSHPDRLSHTKATSTETSCSHEYSALVSTCPLPLSRSHECELNRPLRWLWCTDVPHTENPTGRHLISPTSRLQSIHHHLTTTHWRASSHS